MTPEEKVDHQHYVMTFLEVLGAAGVPVDQYEICFRRARVARARKEAEGKSVSFKITPEEIAAQWFVIQKEQAEKTADDPQNKPAENCSFLNEHIGGESIVQYFPAWSLPDGVVLPCHECRPKAHEQKKAAQIEKHNQYVRSRILEAGAPVPEVVETDVIIRNAADDCPGERCKNCGNEIMGAAVRLSLDFLICGPCDEHIREMRQK